MYSSSKKRFSLICGYRLEPLSAADLKLLYEGVSAFGVEKVRFTPGSQLGVSGLDDEQLDSFTRFIFPLLEPLPDNGITAIFSCNDCGECNNGMGDTNVIVERLSNMKLPQPMPSKIKVAVAGCPRSCTMPRVRDVGFIPASAKTPAWNVFFGGSGGSKPRIGDLIGAGLGVDESLELVNRALTVYQKNAENKMRTSAFLEEVSLEKFLKIIKKKRIN